MCFGGAGVVGLVGSLKCGRFENCVCFFGLFWFGLECFFCWGFVL